jgi:DedD protein
MAFFKFRKATPEPTRAPPASPSIEALRQRAKYRLAGASVLVLLGVIGFPLLFDKQPRSVALDTPIDIPDRNKVQPLALPPVPTATQPVASAAPETTPVASAAGAPASTLVAAKPEDEPASTAVSKVSSAKPATDASAAKLGNDKKAPLAQVEPAKEATKIAATEASKPAASPSTKASDAAKAQTLLEDKSAPPADAGRFVVQVGAFADADRAREVRAKLEKAGLKTYTNIAETKDGPRTRVRVGPFNSKPEAKKAAEKIKQLNLPAAVLTL